MRQRQIGRRRQSYWMVYIILLFVSIPLIWNIYHSFHDIYKTNNSIIEAESFGAPREEQSSSSLSTLQLSEENTEALNSNNNKKDEVHSTYWESSKSVVMGMINGFPLSIYETFVGSLRATGYPGHIILGIANDAPKGTIDYLNSQNVTIKYIENAERCTYNGTKLNNGKIVNMQKEKGWKCTSDHPDYKLTWGRFTIKIGLTNVQSVQMVLY